MDDQTGLIERFSNDLGIHLDIWVSTQLGFGDPVYNVSLTILDHPKIPARTVQLIYPWKYEDWIDRLFDWAHTTKIQMLMGNVNTPATIGNAARYSSKKHRGRWSRYA